MKMSVIGRVKEAVQPQLLYLYFTVTVVVTGATIKAPNYPIVAGEKSVDPIIVGLIFASGPFASAATS